MNLRTECDTILSAYVRHEERIFIMENQKKIVLIVEDDLVLQNIYKIKFEKEGYAVFQANTGQQCMTLLKDIIPDVILLDIMLPEKMNGFDVFEQIKQDQRLSRIPVIMFTNLDSERDTAMKMGAADYIVKANASVEEILNKVAAHTAGQSTL